MFVPALFGSMKSQKINHCNGDIVVYQHFGAEISEISYIVAGIYQLNLIYFKFSVG